MTNDNFISCCGSNTTALIGETMYCVDCDVFANVVAGDIEFTDGTKGYMDRGIIRDVDSINTLIANEKQFTPSDEIDYSVRGVMNTATVEEVIGFSAACLGILALCFASFVLQ